MTPVTRRLILFVVPSLQGGGAERVATTLLRHLDRRRFTPMIAVLDTNDAIYREELPADVEVIDLRSPRARHSMWPILRVVWERRPDVVFSVIGHLNLTLASLRPILPRSVRLVARETAPVNEAIGSYAASALWKRSYRWLYRRLYRRFDTIVCQSIAMQTELIGEFGVSRDRAVVIPNPVDLARASFLALEPVPSESDEREGTDWLRLVAAGRLSHEKGFDLLLEAIALLSDARVHLTLLGDGPLRESLESLAVELGITAQVRFVGFQRNPYRYFARAHAFVLSSRFDAFPNVVLEALACGTPVIATPAAGGIQEMIGGRAGCVIAADVSAESLAAALAAYPFAAGRQVPLPTEYDVTAICARYEDEVFANVGER